MLFVSLQIDMLSIILLLIICFKNISKINKNHSKLFNRAIFSLIIIFLLDMTMYTVDGKIALLNCIATLLYYIFTPIVSLNAMIYLEYQIHHSERGIKKLFMLAFPFLLIYSIACVTSINSGIIFKIDENARYSRGDFFWVSVVLSVAFLLIPLAGAAKIAIKTSDRATRKLNISIITILIPTFAGAIIQYFVYGVSTNWAGALISVFIIFINFQNAAIATDSLTGINNRRLLYRYLESRTSMISDKQKLYLYVIDVDDFKSINDTYGHSEGDNALLYITEMLKNVCDGKRDFLARMGGDEFAIVCQRKNGEDIADLAEMISNKIKRFNMLECAPYKLSLSYGCAEFILGDQETVDEFMKKADDNMYEMKRMKKTARGNC